ncbi:hypothetical protein GCM10020358_40490 [Amorphoplanes nipponensis]|uniref:Malonyl-CoA:ACP transacylase (MAT) domain-containing protein n=1 Tax=Actinoplanes nipponensis TaxID=135950 RepID=A0A919JAF2_9ACTN|nr:acyltransferase domain-containing protein [Actinoplanes nipponensis]GIE47354.1 hypothetical protein Ani05nite_08880 [Actinoplanes nipponensis]
MTQLDVAARATATGTPPSSRPVVLMFPGQGAQQTRMAAGLYRACPVFTAAVDEVLNCFGPAASGLRADWLADRPRVGIDDVSRAQPLLFAVNYALGRMVLDWGVRPAALLGHSVGEVAAATLAGVFRVADAARLLADRVEQAARAPAGGMLAVAASVAEVRPHLAPGVAVGAVNAPRQTMLAGLDAALAETTRRLHAAGLVCRRLGSSVAFHSPAAAHLVDEALPGLARMTLREPLLPLWSAYTTRPLTADTARDPGFWAGHAATPVRFWPTLDRLLGAGDALLVDASPGQSLAAAARRHPAVAAGRSAVVGLLPARRGRDEADRAATMAAAERVRAEGHDIAVPDLATAVPQPSIATDPPGRPTAGGPPPRRSRP